MRQGRQRNGWSSIWPIAALCVLISSRWLLEGVFPGTASTVLTQAAGCLMAAGWLGALVAFDRRRSPAAFAVRGRRWVLAIGAGTLLLSAPLLGRSLSSRHVDANDGVLSMALTPVFVAVAASAAREVETSELTGRLWPGLAGLAGLLLLLPQPGFSGWRFGLALIAMPLLSALGATALGEVLARADLGQRGKAQMRAVALAAAAMVLGAIAAASQGRASMGGFSLAAAGLDGLVAWLTLLALERLGAVRWSAQFLFVPLIGLLEGVVFLRPILDTRSWMGLGLLAVSGTYQLLATPAERMQVIELRGGERVPPA